MAKRFDLTREVIPLTVGNNLQAYKRDGLILNTAPLEEYVRLTAQGLADNQTAVFDIDKYGLDIMPYYLYADFTTTTGNITLSIVYYSNVITSYSITGGQAEVGYVLPQIPISHANTQIRIQTAKACNFIWVSCKQVVLLEEIAQDYFL